MSKSSNRAEGSRPPPTPEQEFAAMRRRFRDAHEAGRGVHLSAREIQILGLSILGQWWYIDDDSSLTKQIVE